MINRRPDRTVARGLRSARLGSVAELLGQERERIHPPGELDVTGEEDRRCAHPWQVAREQCELVDPGRERPAALCGVKIGREGRDGAMVEPELPARIAAG